MKDCPLVDLGANYKLNMGYFETIGFDLRITGFPAASSSKEDIEKARKAMSEVILLGATNMVMELTQHYDKRFFEKVKKLKQTVNRKRKDAT